MVGISVIMPVYNVSNYLANAINSIKNQSFNDLEIICINDGSSDNSLEILNILKKENKNIKVINQKNSGPGIARNTGIANAKGEYIAFLDSDDIFLDKNALEKLYATAKKNDADVVCGNLRWINQDYSLDEYYDYINTKYAYAEREEIIKSEDYGIPFAFYKNIFRRDFLEQHNIRFPDIRAGEDPVFMTKVLTNTDKCHMVPVDLYGYNHSIGGGVNEKINSYEKKYAYITHFKQIFDIFKENNYDSALSLYKNEFVMYYLIYSDNMRDEDVKNIIRDSFSNFDDYFKNDDFGYFIMDYLVNNNLQSNSVDEYELIKKCLFEEVLIKDNFIGIDELKTYAKLMDEDKYSFDENNLKKLSFDLLNNIKTNTHLSYENYEDELKQIKKSLTSSYYENNAEFLRKYSESRIDIKNYGGEKHNVNIIDCDDILCSPLEPSWFTNWEGTGKVLHSTRGEINFTVECVEDGILVLSFKGLDYRDKYDARIPIYIDYTEIIVDGVNIIPQGRVAWHDDPITYEAPVVDGQLVNVRAKWVPLNYKSNLRLFNNYEKLSNVVSEGRIDIKNYGKSENNIKVLNQSDLRCKITQPDWFEDNHGKGSTIESTDGNLDLSIECMGEGNLLIEFRSMDYRDNNDKRIPVLIKYTNIQVNNNVVVQDERVSWHDDPIRFEQKVKDGEIINIHAEWTKFNDKFYDVGELLQEKESLMRENEKLRQFKNTVLESNSWKITSPLRKIKQLKK